MSDAACSRAAAGWSVGPPAHCTLNECCRIMQPLRGVQKERRWMTIRGHRSCAHEAAEAPARRPHGPAADLREHLHHHVWCRATRDKQNYHCGRLRDPQPLHKPDLRWYKWDSKRPEQIPSESADPDISAAAPPAVCGSTHQPPPQPGSHQPTLYWKVLTLTPSV